MSELGVYTGALSAENMSVCRSKSLRRGEIGVIWAQTIGHGIEFINYESPIASHSVTICLVTHHTLLSNVRVYTHLLVPLKMETRENENDENAPSARISK